jgi:hypothetical protein
MQKSTCFINCCLCSFLFLFLRLNKKRNRAKEKKKERYGTSGFYPESPFLFDKQTYQTEFAAPPARVNSRIYWFTLAKYGFAVGVFLWENDAEGEVCLQAI